MFHIINKSDIAVIIRCVYFSYYSDKNYESRCIVIKSVSLNMANKNVAKYTVSFLTLGYILHSSIPITSKMDENFHSLDKEMSVVNSEIYKPQCKDNCDSVIEEVKGEIRFKKSQAEKTLSRNNQINEVIEKIQIKPEIKKTKKIVSSTKVTPIKTDIKVQIKEKKSEPKSEGVVLVGYATAYTASTNARMANGQKPIEGVHCAMNKKYKGRRVKVTIGNDVRYYNVDDTGPLKNGVIIDIYMNDRQRCLNFGKRKVKVEFVSR